MTPSPPLPAGMRLQAAYTFLSLLPRIREKIRRRLLGEQISTPAFKTLLGQLGFVPGQTILLHASMDALHHHLPQLSPLEIITLMMNALGREGTLLMPSFPFRNRQRDYVRSQPVFNVQKSPSRMGLLTEVFRRLPGVVRSRHPTHAVCALGPKAHLLLDTHHLGRAFGPESPFALLVRHRGLEVGLGVQIESYSGLAVALDKDPDMARRVWMAREWMMPVVDGAQTWSVPVRPFRVRWNEENMALLGRMGRLEGVYQNVFQQGLRCATADLAALTDLHARFMAQGWTIFQVDEESPEETAA